MAKMGRPSIDKPKSKQVAVRLDEETFNELKSYCSTNNTTISELLNGFINAIIGNKKE